MSPGACRPCILEGKCHPDDSPCWCCLPGDPWRTWAVRQSKVLPGLVTLLHKRPELAARGWDGERATLAGILRDSAVSNA